MGKRHLRSTSFANGSMQKVYSYSTSMNASIQILNLYHTLQHNCPLRVAHSLQPFFYDEVTFSEKESLISFILFSVILIHSAVAIVSNKTEINEQEPEVQHVFFFIDSLLRRISRYIDFWHYH